MAKQAKVVCRLWQKASVCCLSLVFDSFADQEKDTESSSALETYQRDIAGLEVAWLSWTGGLAAQTLTSSCVWRNGICFNKA